MPDFKLDPERVTVYTNDKHTILGFGAHNITTPITLIHAIGTKLSGIPCETSALIKVSVDQLPTVETDIKNHILDVQDSIIKNQLDLKANAAKMKAISKLAVTRSDRTVEEIYRSLKRCPTEREITWPSFDKTKISSKGIVQFPRGTEPFFYNTEDDLTQFNVGDIVEVKFGTGSKTWARHKGKKLKMVVNNCLPYKYGSDSKKLALTPVTENWLRSDIVFIDSTDRFECLMIDLFQVNRIPFRGWKTKKVSIKKVGHVDTLPKPKPSLDIIDPETLHGTMKTDWLIMYYRKESWSTRHEHQAVRVSRLRDLKSIDRSNAYKITTSTDKHLAIDYITAQNASIEEAIEELKEKVAYYQECLLFANIAREQIYQVKPTNAP